MEGVKYCENEFSATLRLQIGKKYNFSYWGWSKYCKNEFQQVFGLEIAENSFLQYLDPLNMKNRTFCQFFCSQNWKFVLTLFDHPQYEKSYFLASKVMRIRSYNILTPSPQYRYENSYFLTIFRPQNCWKFVLTAFGPPSIWKIVIFDNFSAPKLLKIRSYSIWTPLNMKNRNFWQFFGLKIELKIHSYSKLTPWKWKLGFFANFRRQTCWKLIFTAFWSFWIWKVLLFHDFCPEITKKLVSQHFDPTPPEYAIAKSEKHEPRGF